MPARSVTKKKPAKKKPAKKPAVRKARAKKPITVVVVGMRGSGVSSLVRALAPDAEEVRSPLNDEEHVIYELPGRKRKDAPETRMRVATHGDVRVALHDVPGYPPRSSTRAYDDVVYTKIYAALEAAKVIVHVIDATAPDPERAGACLDRSIYGAWHDFHAAVVPVLAKCDGAEASTLALLGAVWEGAVAVSATTGEGLDALRAAITEAATRRKRRERQTTSRRILDMQLMLVARTRAPCFDGVAIAADLRELVREGVVRALVFLREGAGTYRGEDLVREDDGLRFLARLHEGVWDADTVHLVATTEAQAKQLIARAKERWGAVEAEGLQRSVVRVRWDVTDITTETPPGEPSAQDIHLEIIRRGGFNNFRGDRVAASLLRHHELWRAAAFGRLRTRLPEYPEMYTFLNTVYAVIDDHWNADELWLVVPNAAAEKRVRLLGDLHWFADNIVTLKGEEARRVAGVEAPARVVELWWD